MFATTRIFVPFGQTEIDHVDHLLILTSANQEVIRFYITVYESAGVNVFYALQHLDTNHQDCLKCELAASVLKEIFKIWA